MKERNLDRFLGTWVYTGFVHGSGHITEYFVKGRNEYKLYLSDMETGLPYLAPPNQLNWWIKERLRYEENRGIRRMLAVRSLEDLPGAGEESEALWLHLVPN